MVKRWSNEVTTSPACPGAMHAMVCSLPGSPQPQDCGLACVAPPVSVCLVAFIGLVTKHMSTSHSTDRLRNKQKTPKKNNSTFHPSILSPFSAQGSGPPPGSRSSKRVEHHGLPPGARAAQRRSGGAPRARRSRALEPAERVGCRGHCAGKQCGSLPPGGRSGELW